MSSRFRTANDSQRALFGVPLYRLLLRPATLGGHYRVSFIRHSLLRLPTLGGRDRIEPSGMKRMASAYSLDGQCRTFPNSMHFNALQSILRTGRVKSAGRRFQRGDKLPVETDGRLENRLKHRALPSLPDSAAGVSRPFIS